MADLTTMERAELRTFGDALESFISSVSSHCSNMENGVANCATFMKDEKSQEALRDVAQVCMDIRETLSPAQMLLDKVLTMVNHFDMRY